jgi:hypothetical protein
MYSRYKVAFVTPIPSVYRLQGNGSHTSRPFLLCRSEYTPPPPPPLSGVSTSTFEQPVPLPAPSRDKSGLTPSMKSVCNYNSDTIRVIQFCAYICVVLHRSITKCFLQYTAGNYEW